MCVCVCVCVCGNRIIQKADCTPTSQYISNRIATLLPELGYVPPPVTEDPKAVPGRKEEMEDIWLNRTTYKNDRICAVRSPVLALLPIRNPYMPMLIISNDWKLKL